MKTKKMIDLLQPAMSLMNRLKYPQKFLLISTVFLLPIGLLTSLFLLEVQNRVDFARKEQAGVRYLRPLRGLQENLLQYQFVRDRPARFRQNATNLKQITTEIDADLQSLAIVDQAVGETLKTTTNLKNLQKYWQRLQRDSAQQPFDQWNVTYQELHNQLESLRLQVGDQSNLILDPDLDTYYLMDSILLKLPEIQKQLAQIRLISQRALQQTLTPYDRMQLLTISASLQNLQARSANRMAVAFDNNPAGNLRPQLATDLAALMQTLQTLTQSVNQLASNNSQPQSATYLTRSQLGLEQSFQLWDQTTDELDQLLQRRIDGFEQRQWWVIAFVLLILAITAYLFIGFYLGMMEVVSGLSYAAKRMTNGGSKEVLVLQSQDELAEVVRSFNSVAEALQSAEAKYRGIFENAVEGIFQTSPEGRYLTANPMLAEIYGYASPAELITALTNISHQLYVEPGRRDQFIQLMQAQGSVQGFESQVYRKDGSAVWISESARSVYDAEGRLIEYEGTVEDITRRKQAEAEIVQLTQRLQHENLRMSAELDITRRLQQMLLPADGELAKIQGLEVAGFMEPAAEVGGDYYDVQQQNGKVQISIGDVTGHGLESGVVMIMAQTAVRTLQINGETDPARFLNVVNQIIYDNTRRMRSQKNMSLALLEYDAGLLRMSGQHEELILVRANGRIEQIDTIDLGFPLGLELDITSFVAEVTIQMQPGDVAVLYTDGITEAMNAQNQQYGLDRMHTILKQNYHETAHQIRQVLIKDLMQHIGKQKVFDDITLVVMKQQ